MILPEDTKEPIPSDDEDLFEDDFDEDDLNLTSPPPINSVLYGERNYDYPSSPNSTVTHPLLSYTNNNDDDDVDDIELGPAPPYTPHDPQQRRRRKTRLFRFDVKGELGKKVGKRFILGIAGAIGLWVGLMGISTIGWLLWGGRHGHPHPPQDSSNDAGGGGGDSRLPEDGDGGDGTGGPPFPHNGRFDGEPLGCINFTSSTPWHNFPISEDQPYLPSPLDAEEGSRRSVNSTFIISTHGENSIFAHLAYGPAAIGNMFISTYDSTSENIYSEDTSESNGHIVQKTPNGKSPRKGEYVRIVVETIYNVLPDIEDSQPATIENSPGWELLENSRVCLMHRGLNSTDLQSDNEDGKPSTEQSKRDDEEERHPGPGPGRRPLPHKSSGVSVLSQRPEHSIHSNRTGSSPLQFRFYIYTPSSTASDKSSSSSLVESLMDALTFSGHHAKRPAFIPTLEVRGGASGIYVDDLSTAIGIREINLESGFGEILIQNIKADEISLKTTGSIAATVAVSQSLEAQTPIGDIDLDVTISKSSPFALPPWSNITRPDHPPSSSTDEEDDRTCDADTRPVQIDTRSGNGLTTVRYLGWEQECLGINQDIVALTGDVKVYAHPLFQGSYRLSTVTGPISVDLGDESLPDPEDKGRWRNITLNQRERIGNKIWSGQVTWEATDPDSSSENDEGDEAEDAKEEKRDPRLPSPPSYNNKRIDRVLNARSSVGSIELFF